MKNIHWLVPYNIKDPKDIFLSSLASIRLRTALFNNPIFNQYKLTMNESVNNITEIDYLFVSKPKISLIKEWLEIIDYFRKFNKNLFIDYTDHNLLRDDQVGNFYEHAMKENDHIITSSNKLRNYLKDFKNVTVIEDPIEINIQPVKHNNKNSNFLFFGNPQNLKFLFNLIPNWDNSKEYTLIIQTSEIGLKIIQEESKFIKKPINLNIHLQYWSISNMLKTAENLAGIIIPGDINDLRKNGVSHNRLITSFALGLPVAASRYPSYLEFDQEFIDIDDKSAFENFLKNPSQYSSLVEIAQQKLKSYTPENIAKKWINLIQ